MSINLSLITDEVASQLAPGLRLAAEEGLSMVDVRSIGGVNFMSLDNAAQKAAAREIRDAGMKVGTFATPLLKWPAPGREAADMGDQFGFDAAGRSVDQLYDDAFRCADLLGCRNLRVFSLLKYDDFKLADLDGDYEKLARLAERHDATIHIENEHVCNLHTVRDLLDAMERWRHPRIRALLDIPNAWRTERPREEELDRIAPFVEQAHFKDWSAQKQRIVALGRGDIPFAMLLGPIYREAEDRDITFVVETHVPDDQPDATVASLRALKKLARSQAKD